MLYAAKIVASRPTSVINSCVDVFAPLIAYFAKLSIYEGKFPSSYGTAPVTPVLKKKELDPNIAGKYRPISNLHAVSKILERLILARVRSHVEDSTIFNRFQSGYRRGQSTETALLRMLNHLNDDYTTADKKSRTLPYFNLIFFAPFDTLYV